jgi:hypothetical protein
MEIASAAMARVRAVRSHESSERLPLQVAPGDVVDVGRRDTEWPAFVFVTAAAGSGWVPSRHLSADRGSAIVVTAYDTTELATEVGEIFDVIRRDDASGWLWCRSVMGAEGWVPMRTLVELPAENGSETREG